MSSLSLDLFHQRLRRMAGHAQPLRVLLTLGSLMAIGSLSGHAEAMMPLFLGAIASALAETDDSGQGRLRAQAVTLACFAAAAFAVVSWIDHPLLFVPGLALAAFSLTMLGAIEPRYKAVGFATLALAIYAMLGIDGSAAAPGGTGRLGEALWLLAGAAWYGVFSVAWCTLFPAQPVQAQLAGLFRVLGDYVCFKASLFEPLRGIDMERKRLSLAQLNTQVVGELNAAKEGIFRRIGSTRAPTGRIVRYRGLYLIAQDVHERATSSHEDYNALADAFFHSDLLYRCQRVLALQGEACRRLALSIERREPFAADPATGHALAELQSAIDHERAQLREPRRVALLASVEALAWNLAQLERQLAGATEPSARAGRADMGLFDRSPRSGREMAERVRRQLTPRSALFRHALRLAVALVAGYGVMLLIHPVRGYWILLTTLFVCQQAWGDTVSRVGQRIAGTALGVVAGWALLVLFPQPWAQSLLAVAAGVFFFATRATRYLLATAAVTVLVLMCFNQVGDSDALMVPRLIDTAIGSLIAALAMLLVLPHWQARRFSDLAAAALRNHAHYLRQIAGQYRSGARDDLAYRLARRNAHNADATLSTAVFEMFREPGFVRPRAGTALRFLIQSHTLLSYLSALGAHRVALPAPQQLEALRAEAEGAAAALDALASYMEGGSPDTGEASAEPVDPAPPETVPQESDASGHAAKLFRTELALVRQQIEALREQAGRWLQPQPDDAPRN
ncbi:YccS/YhfK family integral membrane protein [Variovorax paradoxus]|uniref:YccS/YhfK family integral membrane protein n=1 Tax=Variovorax paradoxus TaxID=34073 RepID=A0AAE4C0Y7_VARPD|nr:YccS family putative transporter [Variovorax paradoxus]MDR6428855.1 YccS/YhfK family integral membrane protein [Variovorax paradoxus]MDR6455819.1 YccS/YhfK family integral membrane protein [Variovorax paradoxus]